MTKNPYRPIPPLPPDASEEEIIHWVDTYNVVDRLKAGVSEVVEDHSDLDGLLEQALEEGTSAELKIPISPAAKAVLTRFAQERAMDIATLARSWLVERIRQELKKM